MRLEGLDIKFQNISLGESFNYLVKVHYKAISAGLRLELQRFNEKQEGASFSLKRVIFGTRKYSLKQPEHNTKIEEILPLVKCLFQNGWEVINIGSPALRLESELGVNEAAACKESSNLSAIDEEFEQLIHPIVCRADVDLIDLAAAPNTPLLLVSDEWSPRFGIDLIDTRAQLDSQYDLMEALGREPQDVVDWLTRCYRNT